MTPEQIEQLKKDLETAQAESKANKDAAEKAEAEAKAKADEAAEAKSVNDALAAQLKTVIESGKTGVIKTKKIGDKTYSIPYPKVNHKGTVLTADEIVKEKNAEKLAEYIEFGILV